MDLEAFRTQFPEFRQVPIEFVQAHLDAVLLELDAVIWGSLIDQGQGYLAAHKMALSPFGQNARLIGKDGSTTYRAHFDALLLIVAGGGLVL